MKKKLQLKKHLKQIKTLDVKINNVKKTTK